MTSAAWSPDPVGWLDLDDTGLAGALADLLGPLDHPPLVLVDGHSGSGKTTFATAAAQALRAGWGTAAVVHTDDLAWCHDPIHWTELLVDGVLAPWRRGEAVAFRPPAWVTLGRSGAVTVPAGQPSLVVEGVGAGRAELAALADLVVWVASHEPTARTRGIARDVESGRSPADAVAFWREWMSAEAPFLAGDRPWERARLIVDGTPLAFGALGSAGARPPGVAAAPSGRIRARPRPTVCW